MRHKNKGFTLAELLIVVAIIGVLVAISIPIFSKQLEKSRDATSVANIRSAYAEAQAEYITCEFSDNHKDGGVHSNAIKGSNGKIIMTVNFKNGSIYQICVMNVELKGKVQNNWSGMGNNLPFKVKDNHVAGKWMVVFTNKIDGSLNSTDILGMPDGIK